MFARHRLAAAPADDQRAGGRAEALPHGGGWCRDDPVADRLRAAAGGLVPPADGSTIAQPKRLRRTHPGAATAGGVRATARAGGGTGRAQSRLRIRPACAAAGARQHPVARAGPPAGAGLALAALGYYAGTAACGRARGAAGAGSDQDRAGGVAAWLLGGGLDAVAGGGGGGARLAAAALRDPTTLRPGGMTDTIERAAESNQPDEAEWEQAPRALRRESEAPVLSVDGFEGPLDWLLELVRTHRLDLSRLSIVALIEAFASALEQALQQGRVRQAAASLSRWADWLVMAATLTQLRARLILSNSAPEAQAANREADELRRQLLSRQHIQAATDRLERRQQLGLQVWARGRSEQGVADAATTGGDLTELMRACLVALALPVQLADTYQWPPRTLWPVQRSIARICDRLKTLPDHSALAAFLPKLKVEEGGFWARSALASTFAASLELARDGQLTLDQKEAWQPILVSRHGSGGCHERPRTPPTADHP